MDGFDVRGGVILIAATNRPDILDPALLRPGRFDRQISVDAPDLAGREEILKVHSRGKPMAPDVDLLERRPPYAGLHRRRPGQRAQRGGAAHGPPGREADRQRSRSTRRSTASSPAAERTRLMSEKEKLITAYHEGGHALVAAALPGTDPVHKITILPRGRALGYTMVLPDEDKYSQHPLEMLDKLAYMLGGRAAEEMVFHDPTTGAGNDIEKATSVARAMVTQYGMTERLGAIKLGEDNARAVPGPRHRATPATTPRRSPRSSTRRPRSSSPTAHQEAFDILEQNRDVLDALVLELLEKETLDKAQVAEIFDAAAPARPRVPPGPAARPRAVDDPAGGGARGGPRPAAANGAPARRARAGVVLTPPRRRR